MKRAIMSFLRIARKRFGLLVNSIIVSKPISTELKGKNLLVIGDSISADFVKGWQFTTSRHLGLKLRTHARGGIGILEMIDGYKDKSITNFDPFTNVAETLNPLSINDVKDADIIIMMGFYNERHINDNEYGNINDLYPLQDSFCGKLNYAINRIQSLLSLSNNKSCRIVLCSMHKCGSYSWNPNTYYDGGKEFVDALKEVSNKRNLPCIDLTKCKIGKDNWHIYQHSLTDNVHPNRRGYKVIGEFIAEELLKLDLFK